MKKVTKIFAFAVAICMLFSVTTTTAFAEETITNMTYDEWLHFGRSTGKPERKA